MAAICFLDYRKMDYLKQYLSFREYLEIFMLYSFRWQEMTMPCKRGNIIYERICENYETNKTIYCIFTCYHINIHDSSMCKNGKSDKGEWEE